MDAASIGSQVMSKLPLMLLVAAFTGAACGETVPLNNPGAGGSDNRGQSGQGGDDAAVAGADVGGSASPVGGGAGTGGASATGGTSSTGGEGASSAGTDGMSGDAGHATAGDHSGGAAGSGVVMPPPVCETTPAGPVAGGSRLKALCVISQADGSQIVRRGKLFDSELGAECSYRAAADGQWRCLPTLHQRADVTPTVGFADDQCTQRVTWFPKPLAGCALDLPKYVYQLAPAPVCGHQSGLEHPAHVFALGALIAQPVPLYAKSGNSCSPVVASNDQVWYAVSSERPASEFVLGTKTVAP